MGLADGSRGSNEAALYNGGVLPQSSAKGSAADFSTHDI